MTRLSRPLDKALIRAADDKFYDQHPELVKDGQPIPLSETNPAHADLRDEWIRTYQKAGGAVEPKEQVPLSRPGNVVQPCPDASRKDPTASRAAGTVPVQDASAEEQKIVAGAHARAKLMVDSAINKCLEQAKLASNPLVSSYFGINGTTESDKKKIDQVIENYKKIGSELNSASYEVEHEVIKPGEPYTVAYVYSLPVVHGIGDAHVVFPAFAMQSVDDRANTIVHEMSHYAIGTGDHAYDWETTKWNRLTQAEKMDNAENYGDFARDCYSANARH